VTEGVHAKAGWPTRPRATELIESGLTAFLSRGLWWFVPPGRVSLNALARCCGSHDIGYADTAAILIRSIVRFVGRDELEACSGSRPEDRGERSCQAALASTLGQAPRIDRIDVCRVVARLSRRYFRAVRPAGFVRCRCDFVRCIRVPTVAWASRTCGRGSTHVRASVELRLGRTASDVEERRSKGVLGR